MEHADYSTGAGGDFPVTLGNVELEIIQLLVSGSTPQQVSEALPVSPRTTHLFMETILWKLDMRPELAKEQAGIEAQRVRELITDTLGKG